MLAFTAADEIVYEPFSGSGTSLLAGEHCGRQMRAVEIAPEYVDVALTRFTRAHPEIQPILAASGKTFEEVTHERQSDG
jgi:DNA modification methylase